jgi:Caspase domain
VPLIQLALSVALCAVLHAQAAPARRALLIGINDYTASRLGPRPAKVDAARDVWPNLVGTLNDVAALRELLTLLYGFAERDIVTLTDQQATRAAIMKAMQDLAAKASKDDVVLFYYAGHGSQVTNSRSDEPDKLDETIVPADSRIGASDIRDKELRTLFNRMLDRGARLTVILDACHSGSGARGLPSGARVRGVSADQRDIADGKNYGPRPENRGALVIAASQDFDRAYETVDDQGRSRGSFSWAWLRALRDAAPGEAVEETFLRAQARLRAETPYQEPVLAGVESVLRAPFLGVRGESRGERTVIAVSRLKPDGTVVLQGGWVNGLAVGTILRTANAQVIVTEIKGLARSEARVDSGRVQPGALLEVAGWAVPRGRPLRVWMPHMTALASSIAELAKSLAAEAARRNVRWVSDPTETVLTHLLRWSGREWELLGPTGTIERFGGKPAAAIAKLPARSALFVQLPAPAAIAAGMSDGVEPAARVEEADYILAGRFAGGKLQYAWVRPGVGDADRRKSGLPLRTAWVPPQKLELRKSVIRLRKIHGWYLLEPPPGPRYPYRLHLRQAETRNVIREGVVRGGETYSLLLRAASNPPPQRVAQRFLYVFSIDCHGKSVLLFPQSGSVENRFPLTDGPAPAEIPLGFDGAVAIEKPYGIDTYFLLSTDEALPNPWILEWDGVRAGRVVQRANWSIERVIVESVAP